MKLAILSDIHGNYIALQSCLKHAWEQQVDAYLFLISGFLVLLVLRLKWASISL